MAHASIRTAEMDCIQTEEAHVRGFYDDMMYMTRPKGGLGGYGLTGTRERAGPTGGSRRSGAVAFSPCCCPLLSRPRGRGPWTESMLVRAPVEPLSVALISVSESPPILLASISIQQERLPLQRPASRPAGGCVGSGKPQPCHGVSVRWVVPRTMCFGFPTKQQI